MALPDVELSSEQAEAVRWMAAREAGPTPGGGILADDVGKGKTFVAAGLLRGSPLWPTLIVVPKSTMWEWIGVLHRVARMSPCVLTSPTTAQLRDVSRSQLVLSTLGIVSTRVVPPEVADRVWGRVILDEAHAIRNPNTLAHKALRALRAHAKWAFTATPVQNTPGDLLALARFVGFNTDDAEAVRREIMLRRINLAQGGGGDTRQPSSKLDVETVRVHLTVPGEKELYDKVHKLLEAAAADAVAGGIAKLLLSPAADKEGDEDGCEEVSKEDTQTNGAAGSTFERLLRCRQAATHPGIYHRSMAFCRDRVKIGDDKASGGDHREGAADWALKPSSKLNWLYNDLINDPGDGQDDSQKEGPQKEGPKKEGGRRVPRSVVFCDWLDEMVVIQDFLTSKDVHTMRYDGSLNVYEREDVLEAFKRPNGPRVLLLQVQCGACGLNLQSASRVYMMRPQWNPAVEYQAIGRVHRSGQANAVVRVRRLVAVGTVDEAMDARLKGKARSITSVMHDDALERCLLAV